MISPGLFLFIERVVAARMDIIVQNGGASLGTSGWCASMAAFEEMTAQMTPDLRAEIVAVFNEGEFDRWYLHEFLMAEPPDTVADLWPGQVRDESPLQ
jgi:hypothetical protein